MENNWHSIWVPVLSCELNFNHMSVVRAILPFKSTSLGGSPRFCALTSVHCHLSAHLFTICVHFPLQWNPRQTIILGCNYRNHPSVMLSLNPLLLCCRAQHFTYVELSDINGLRLNLNQRLPYGNIFCYQLSLQASQRSSLSEAITR